MTGHIRRRGAHSWELTFDAGSDPLTGKRKTKYRSFRGSKREAQIELARLMSGAPRGPRSIRRRRLSASSSIGGRAGPRRKFHEKPSSGTPNLYDTMCGPTSALHASRNSDPLTSSSSTEGCKRTNPPAPALPRAQLGISTA